MSQQDSTSEQGVPGARIMFWMWMATILAGFAIMAVVVGSGR